MDNIKDEWNPTPQEIRECANNPTSLCEQDWELAIAEFKNFDLMIELVNDQTLSKKRFFLGCLYVFVGDIIEANERSSINQLQNLIAALDEEKISDNLRQWKARSLAIIEDKEYIVMNIGDFILNMFTNKVT